VPRVDRKVAEEINSLMIEETKKFQQSIVLVKKSSDEEEYQLYADPVAHIIAIMFDVLDGIYKQYPDLKPDTFD
jgi:hypothetical protein